MRRFADVLRCLDHGKEYVSQQMDTRYESGVNPREVAKYVGGRLAPEVEREHGQRNGQSLKKTSWGDSTTK